MKSIDLALYEAIKELGEHVSDETAKKMVDALHAIYGQEAEQAVIGLVVGLIKLL